MQIGEFLGRKLKFVYDTIINHMKDHNNPHKVTKYSIGLGNVDNTSDKDKPLSDATKEAIGNISSDLNALERDVDMKIDRIKSGEIIAGKSEYAQKLGTEQDSFTKSQI